MSENVEDQASEPDKDVPFEPPDADSLIKASSPMRADETPPPRRTPLSALRAAAASRSDGTAPYQVTAAADVVKVVASLHDSAAASYAEMMAPLRAAIAPQMDKFREMFMGAAALDISTFTAFTAPKIEIPHQFLNLLKQLEELDPPNWPDNMDYDRLDKVIEDGLPLVWVPRAEVVSAILAAPDREARVQVLVAHRQGILADCEAVLAQTDHASYVGDAQLGLKAVRALSVGADEAAQALAVVVLDTSTQRAINPDHNKVQHRVKVPDLDELTVAEFRLLVALAPLNSFLTPWTEGKTPGPRPEALSRHVSVHAACPEHYTEGNAIIAVMLMTSVLRAYQELAEARAALSDPFWPWPKR